MSAAGPGPFEDEARARLSAARTRWPGIALDDAPFVAHLSQLAAGDAGKLAGLHIDDLFLAWACSRGDRAALAELDGSVLSLVPRWVQGFEGVSADDVQQELRHKLLTGPAAHLLDYTGRGALDRWVRVAASRIAIDLQRKRKPESSDDAVDTLLSQPDPEIDFVKVHDREVLRSVLRDAVRSLPARQLGLLRLHYLEGVSLEKLAALERVHRATVARWLADARADALKKVRELLRDRLKLSSDEGDSLVRFLGSRLDLSLRSALSPRE
jgi:RNA polymerase sigma-70 factor (ECF subfamily)